MINTKKHSKWSGLGNDNHLHEIRVARALLLRAVHCHDRVTSLHDTLRLRMSQRLCNDGVSTDEGRGKDDHHSAGSEQLKSRTVTGGDGEDRAFRAVLRYEPGRAACLGQGDDQWAL